MLLFCGLDEAGYGTGAAEVYVSSCILHPERPIEGLKDSKKLTPGKREVLAEEIKKKALCWCTSRATLEEIERLNVRGATLLAMKRAVEGLSIRPHKVFVDGLYLPDIDVPAVAVVKGDGTVPAISAASILAKVTRDRAMMYYHEQYPQYGFDQNKGYLTRAHLEALRKHGPCPIHRKTYKPIRELMGKKDIRQMGFFNGQEGFSP